MNCRRCGNINPDNTINCTKCGELLIGRFINVSFDNANDPSFSQSDIQNSFSSINSYVESNIDKVTEINKVQTQEVYFNKDSSINYSNNKVMDNHLQGYNNNNLEKKSPLLKITLIVLSIVVMLIIGFVLMSNVLFKNDDNIYFISPDVSMNVDETQQLSLSYDNGDVNYRSSDEKIAIVSNGGYVTAVGVGTVYITAYNANFEIVLEIIVNQALEEQKINFEQAKITINEEENYQLKLNGVSNEEQVIYKVENDDIVSVSNTGVVVGKKKGITTVKALVGNLEASIEIEVLAKYTVSLDNNGDVELLDCVTLTENCEIILPDLTTKYDNFIGWSELKSDLTPKYKSGQSIVVQKNITLYAVFTEKLLDLDEYKFSKVTSVASRNKKVLVIEIDPYLNSKSKKVSEFLGQNSNVETMLSNLKTDISYSSNNNVKVEIVGREYLNEFPTYKEQVTLLNGEKSYRFDEETYLSVFNNGWHGWWETTNSDFKKMDSDKLFDYNYIIDKFDLVRRRNNNEFDEVWLITIDPASTYETAMVGRTAYWINGEGIIKDCDNFVIAGFTISRVDSPLECLGHASENILSTVFGTNLSYEKDNMNVTKDNYDDLNLWQKFTLVNYLNSADSSDLSGVGAIHFAPNSTIDYDWLNETKVESNWIDWKNNYPYLTGETSLVNYKTWNSSKNEYYAGRYFHRWWFSLMPHVSGYTKDGYSNNWWDYLYTLDYVTSLSSKDYTYSVGEKINNIVISSKYQSGDVKTEKLTKYQPNMIFSNSSILKVNSDGELIANCKGETTLKYYRDGQFVSINIVIE